MMKYEEGEMKERSKRKLPMKMNDNKYNEMYVKGVIMCQYSVAYEGENANV